MMLTDPDDAEEHGDMTRPDGSTEEEVYFITTRFQLGCSAFPSFYQLDTVTSLEDNLG